jgi:hypothetical protein
MAGAHHNTKLASWEWGVEARMRRKGVTTARWSEGATGQGVSKSSYFEGLLIFVIGMRFEALLPRGNGID